MSDIAPTPAAPAADPAAPAPAPAAPAPAPAPAEDAWATTDPADFGTWPEGAKDYVKRLRDESASKNEKIKALAPFQETFSTLHPQDADFFRSFVDALQTRDPAKIAPFAGPMRELLDGLSPAEAKAVVKAAEAAAGDPTFDPYDTDALDQRVDSKLEERFKAEETARQERDRLAQQERATQEWLVTMQGKAKELAETHKIPELGDPTSDLGRLLYVVAHNKFSTESDPMKRLELAAQSIEETLGTSAQALLKAKTADAAPSPAPADAAAPAAAKKPRDLSDARESAKARLDKILGTGGVGT